jgi:FlaA1/EpsC-like NDP-sugar epimerase
MAYLAPPGQAELGPATVATLRELTADLVAARGDEPAREYQRFVDVHRRGLELNTDRLRKQLGGRTILVTGGTGCIGSSLLEQLKRFGPARIVSVSRGVTQPRRVVEGVDYMHADIRDADALTALFGGVKPDVVYHLAAQHDPSLAEKEVARTLSTNITGTRNVIDAARQTPTTNGGMPQIVYASTGKALRPVTPDTYAASKKAGEFLMADAAQQGGVLCSGVRFTHVVDNSIIAHRMAHWIYNGEPMRLHSPETNFYLQSAIEAAQLLMNSGSEAEPGVFMQHAIRDLGLPANLLNLALGAIQKSKTVGQTPIYFPGYEPGYEEKPYPGLYDPRTAGDVSPLINAFEAAETLPSKTCVQVDRFPFRVDAARVGRTEMQILERLCANGAGDESLHWARQGLSWAMLTARLHAVEPKTLERTYNRMMLLSARQTMPPEHDLTNEAIGRVLKGVL